MTPIWLSLLSIVAISLITFTIGFVVYEFCESVYRRIEEWRTERAMQDLYGGMSCDVPRNETIEIVESPIPPR
jgi:hypothetical protein